MRIIKSLALILLVAAGFLALPAQAAITNPTVSGTSNVGEKLTVDFGSIWDQGETPKIQWLRDLEPIPLASGNSYTLQESDFGKSITVRLEAKISGQSSIRYSLPYSRVGIGNSEQSLSENYASQIDAGANHTCVAQLGGSVQCVGQNSKGQLGDGTVMDRNLPVYVNKISTAIAVSAGTSHTCALLSGGKISCWGSNLDGRLGDGTTSNRLEPASVVGISNAVGVFAGDRHTCALIFDGTFKCWGYSNNGQLGVLSTQSMATAVQVQNVKNIVSASVGNDHSCVVELTGLVWCWGYNGSGRLGNGAVGFRVSTPVLAATTPLASEVAAGNGFSCLKTRPNTMQQISMQCWGDNSYNKLAILGDSRATVPSPTYSYTTEETRYIAAGFDHACILSEAGKVMCWGRNSSGQLGDQTTTDYPYPADHALEGLSGITAISLGNSHSCALEQNGNVKCWGSNQFGQLGNGSNESSLAPVNSRGFAMRFIKTLTPTLSGLIIPNRIVTVALGELDEGVHLTYQWYLDGNPIVDATTAEFNPTADLVGKSIAVEVTYKKVGYSTFTAWSSNQRVLESMLVAPEPTIFGIPVVGNRLQVSPGDWEEGVSLTYQWNLGGTPILGATKSTYIVANLDAGQPISVRVTGSKAGYASATGSSAETDPVGGGRLVHTPIPTISGTVRIGSSITAVTGNWDSEVELSYQWLLNGSEVEGATEAQYTVAPDDYGKRISVKVSGFKYGYYESVKTSKQTSKVALRSLTKTATPSFSGTVSTGQTVTAVAGEWEADVSFSYQWLLDGKAIKFANTSSYTIPKSARGHKLSLQITGSKVNCLRVTKTSSTKTVR